jgi:hypothetical protein
MTITFAPTITSEMSRQERVTAIYAEYRKTPEGTALVEASDAYDRAYAACRRHGVSRAEVDRLIAEFVAARDAMDAARQRYDAAR